jgi:predicted amidohydrolase
MKIHCCQLDTVWESKAENFKRIESLLSRRKISRGALVILPEMFATGFSMDSEAIAEDEGGPTDRFLRKLARDNGIFVLGGLARRAPRGLIVNEAICIAPSGRRISRYAKLHLFSPGDESLHYSSGAAVTVFRLGDFKMAAFICYDLRFPEIFRMAAQLGAEALVVIANWPAQRHSHWRTLLCARAIENQAYAIGVNRCGKDPKLGYRGGSLVVNPWGKIVVEGGRREAIISAKLDLAVVNQVRRNFPILRDARTRFALEGR